MPRPWSRRPFLIYSTAVVGPTLVVMALGFVAVRRQHEALEALRAANQRLQEARMTEELERTVVAVATSALDDVAAADLASRLASGDPGEVDRARAAAGALRTRHPIIDQVFVAGVEGVHYPRTSPPLPRTIDDLLHGEAEPSRTRLRGMLEHAARLESSEAAAASGLYADAVRHARTKAVQAFATAALARSRAAGGDSSGAREAWVALTTRFSDEYNPVGRPYAVVAAAELLSIGGSTGNTGQIRDALLQGRWTLTPEQADYFVQRLAPDHRQSTGRFLSSLAFARRLQTAFTGGPIPSRTGVSFAALATADGVEQLFYVAGPDRRYLAGFSADLHWIRTVLFPGLVSRLAPGTPADLHTRPPTQVGFRPDTSVWQVSLPGAAPAGRRPRSWQADLMVFAAVTVIVLGVLVMGVVLLARDVARETDLNRMRADLASGVSHELKTPLSVIRIHAETIDEAPEMTAQERRHFTAAIVQETERLRRLVDDVVDFSRIQQGQRTYRLQEGSLATAVARAVATFRSYAELHGFTVAATIDASAPPVLFDPVAVEQAVLNLLDNAAKYSGDSTAIGVRLSASAGTVVVEVEDHGIGIARSEQDRIFERFHRGVHANRGGYGLGLYLVRHIMEAHGGRVEVSSAAARGSCFRLFFPEATPASPEREHAKGTAG